MIDPRNENHELELFDECKFANDFDQLLTAYMVSGQIFVSAFRPLAAGTFSDAAAAEALDMLAPRGPGRQMFDAACAVTTGFEGDFEVFSNTIRHHIRAAMASGRCKPDRAKRARSKGSEGQGDLFEGDLS